jgi:hypothetical protein
MGKLTWTLAALSLLLAACGSAKGANSGYVDDNPGSGPVEAGASGSSGGAGSAGSAPDRGADAGAELSVADDGGGAGEDSGSGSAGDDGSVGVDAETDGAAPSMCETGQVQPSEVVMLGDSYLDPNFGNVGPTLMMIANAMYRPYYIGGASINGGSGQFNIPYQFDSMAVPANPDIKVVIMDGGGNDILLDNRQCLTTPVAGDTSCHTVINDVMTKVQQLIADEASKGTEHIVYFFYPHIDTTTIYSGADANDWLDYAYPLAAQSCCGSSAPGAGAADLTCHGSPVPGLDCTFVDTRPEFVGHNDPTMSSEYWFDAFGIHPNKQGAGVLANKVWQQMQKYCVAQ